MPCCKQHRTSSKRTYILGAMLCGGLSMLIWIKLRVVTGVPRTAYADPAAEKLNSKTPPRQQGDKAIQAATPTDTTPLK